MSATGRSPHRRKRRSRPTSRTSLVRLYRNSDLQGEQTQNKWGDLAQTTHQQYGDRLHEYTVKEAIHDGAVLGFKVDYRNTIISDLLEEEIPDQAYEDKKHMLEVLDAILNKSQQQLNIPKGVGKSYEAILTVKSIPRAQAYYNLLKSILAWQGTGQSF